MGNTCQNCQAELAEISKFCTKCGTKVEGDTVSLQVEQPQHLLQKLNKKMIGFVIVALLAIGGIIWLMNKTPLQGTWYYDELEVTISGKKATLTANESDFTLITISGPLTKESQGIYTLPLQKADFAVTVKNVFDSEVEFNELLEEIKEEIHYMEVSSTEVDQVSKFLDTMTLDGSDLNLEFTSKDIQTLSLIELDDFFLFDYEEDLNGGFQFLKQSDDYIEMKMGNYDERVVLTCKP